MTDIVFPMVLDAKGAIASTSDLTRIWRQRVYAVISTYVGQRVMRPKFGTKSLDMVFETDRSLAFVANDVISRAFSESLPGFTLTSIEVGDEFRDGGKFTVSITYTTPQGIPDAVSVPFSTDTFTNGG